MPRRLSWMRPFLPVVIALSACSPCSDRRADATGVAPTVGPSPAEPGPAVAPSSPLLDPRVPSLEPAVAPTPPIPARLPAVGDESHGPREPGRWAFTPGRDRFDRAALLDLSYLNESEAGEHGFIRVDRAGDFVRGDGKPIRFWAAHSGGFGADLDAWDEHARWLAKRGVNLVRWHGNIVPKGEGEPLAAIDESARAELWAYVAAMKRHGIYLALSPYHPHATRVKASWSLDSDDMAALLFFEPRVQAAYKAWLRALLVPPNPHTGVPLKDEPAVAIIQMQNEDSMLFWTMDAVAGRDLHLLQERFFSFAVEKYGSVARVHASWSDVRLEGDDPDANRYAFYPLWELTARASEPGVFGPEAGVLARKRDQTEFWTETMRAWNAEVRRFLREEIGATQLFNAGNWKTADPVTLNDAERYSYTPGEVIAVNRYTGGGPHRGEHHGWAITAGDTFQDVSVLLRPEAFPLALKQVAGKPMILSESSWVPPTGHQSEGPFLVAAYASLTGVDALFWFTHGRPDRQFRQPGSANGVLPSLGKWVVATPELAGNYPAAALMHRNGYLRRGAAVVDERRRPVDLFARKVPVISEQGTYDPNRDRGDFPSRAAVTQEVDRLAFLAGPVQVGFGGDPAESAVADLSGLVDRGAKRVRSNTGELTWDYGQGICELQSPRAAGVTGFLGKRGTFDLGAVRVRSDSAYATVLVVSMDGQPLAASRHVLVQAGTTARPTGFRVAPAVLRDGERERPGFRIVDIGRAPFQVVDNDAELSVQNPFLSRAIALDMNGMARGEVAVAREGERLSFRLPRAGKYVVLR